MSYIPTLETELNEEQQLILETVREFAENRVKPLARKIDHEHYFPVELIPELGSLGFLGMNVDPRFGGARLDYVSYALVIEELARVCASTSVIVSAHNSLCLWPLEKFGSEEQKQRYLPKLTRGEWIGCFALSEPGTGSDAARQSCIAKREGDGWVINGVKNWITNGPVADLCVVFAMTDQAAGHKGISAFLVELKNTPGVSIGKKEEKLGICGSPTSSIILEEARLPQDALLGEVGQGFKIAMMTLDGGRIGIGAQAVGIARAALEDSLQYSKERQAFGVPISQHQSIQNYLADMSVSIDSSRLMVLHAARRKDRGLSYTRQAAQAKLLASETAVACALKGIQIHGGYGYVKEFNVERYLRDSKITEIYEGTSEIQRLVIAQQLLKDE
jgi:butyryl-CoA dehydrogenase